MTEARRYGLAGLAFTVLLLGSAAASLPASGQPPAEVATFYAAHRAAVLVTQGAGAVAALVFLAYSAGLGGYAVRESTPRTWTGVRVGGVLVAAAALLTLVPPVVLAAIARGGRGGAWIGRWNRAYDLTDALLFLAIAFWCFLVAVETRRMPRWLRALAGAEALVAIVRAGLGVPARSSPLDAIAPFGFVAVVVLTSVWLIRWARPEPDAPGGGGATAVEGGG